MNKFKQIGLATLVLIISLLICMFLIKFGLFFHPIVSDFLQSEIAALVFWFYFVIGVVCLICYIGSLYCPDEE